MSFFRTLLLCSLSSILSSIRALNFDDLTKNEIQITDIIEEWRSRLPECGLPTFTNALPLKYRRDLRRIWDGFPLASKTCASELRQTKSVLESLPDELKLRILDYRRITTTESPRTSFLTALSTNERIEFSKILSNRSISEMERFSLLREWANVHLDMIAQQQFEQYVQFLKAKAQRFEEKIRALSAEARLAFDKIEFMRREKQTIFNGLSEEAKSELSSLWRPRCPRDGERRRESTELEENQELDAEELQLACSTGERNSRLVIDPMRRRRPTTTTTVEPPRGPDTLEVTITPSPPVEILRFRPTPHSNLYNIVTTRSPTTEPSGSLGPDNLTNNLSSVMNTEHISTILRRIFPNSHFKV